MFKLCSCPYSDYYWYYCKLRDSLSNECSTTGWWFGTWLLFSHILGIIIPTDSYFSEGFKPPTRKEFQIKSNNLEFLDRLYANLKVFHHVQLVSLYKLSCKVKAAKLSTVSFFPPLTYCILTEFAVAQKPHPPGKVKNPYPNVDAHSGQLMYFYNLRNWDAAS